MHGPGGVSTKARDVGNALSDFGYWLRLVWIAHYSAEETLWLVLRRCPGNRPLMIAIEVEDRSHWIATRAGGLPLSRPVADGSGRTLMRCTSTDVKSLT
jgi:hypothetical protein